MRICFSGPIVAGRGLGKTVEMPTVNIDWQAEQPEVLPSHGVYLSEITIHNQKHYGLSNFGLRPTVDDEDRVTLETYLFQYIEGPLGQRAEVCLLEFIRPTKAFASLQEVKDQVDLDLLRAKELIGKSKA